MVDPDKGRRPAAAGLGAAAVAPEDARDCVGSLTGGRGADAVIEASGSEAALTLALELVSSRGTVSVVGAHFNPAAPIDLGRMFANETTLRFSIGAPTDEPDPWRRRRPPADHLAPAPAGAGRGGLRDPPLARRHEVYREDNFTVRTRSGPRAMATLRKLAVGALHLTGRHDATEATRWPAAT